MMTATEVENRKAKLEKQPLPAQVLRGLHAEWRKLSPGLQGSDECRVTSDQQDPERALRLCWTNQQLIIHHPSPITSWSQLSTGQAKYLLKKMREELGESPLNDYIARAAVRLWGAGWNEALAERIAQRFKRGPEIAALEFWMKKALFEELVRRIAREQVSGARGQVSGEDPAPDTRNPTPAQVEAVRMEIVRQKG